MIRKFSILVGILSSVLLLGSCKGTLPLLEEEVTIDGAVGKLSGDVYRPETKGRTCPVAIIYHGLTGYRSEPHLATICDSLNAHGIATVRFDFNGHGKSEGEFVDMTLQNEFEDAKAVFSWVESLPWVDKDRIAIVGHSQGGLEAGLVAGEFAGKVDCAVLLSPAPCIHFMALEGNMFGTTYSADEIPEWVEFWGGRHLGRAYMEGAKTLDPYGKASQYKGPVMIIQGMNENQELIRDSRRYREVFDNLDYRSLDGFTHCYAEDLSVPAILCQGFISENFSKK